jgi:hypothetical protein
MDISDEIVHSERRPRDQGEVPRKEGPKTEQERRLRREEVEMQLQSNGTAHEDSTPRREREEPIQEITERIGQNRSMLWK